MVSPINSIGEDKSTIVKVYTSTMYFSRVRQYRLGQVHATCTVVQFRTSTWHEYKSILQDKYMPQLQQYRLGQVHATSIVAQFRTSTCHEYNSILYNKYMPRVQLYRLRQVHATTTQFSLEPVHAISTVQFRTSTCHEYSSTGQDKKNVHDISTVVQGRISTMYNVHDKSTVVQGRTRTMYMTRVQYSL